MFIRSFNMQALTSCPSDTYVGPAPAHVEDFWSGPSQLGTRQILPEWRRFVADVFQSTYRLIFWQCHSGV